MKLVLYLTLQGVTRDCISHESTIWQMYAAEHLATIIASSIFGRMHMRKRNHDVDVTVQ